MILLAIILSVLHCTAFAYREQLRNFRSSLHDIPSSLTPPPFTSSTNDRPRGFNTEERLAEQKEWLKKFQQDLSYTHGGGGGGYTSVGATAGFGNTYAKAPGSDAGSVYPL